jgi:tripartite-type tricarboxylate transporter receptor subunit TctC
MLRRQRFACIVTHRRAGKTVACIQDLHRGALIWFNPPSIKLGFDTLTDLAPVSLVAVSPQILLVHPSVPATNIKELVAWAKASPGKHSYAHAGLGTPGYLAGEML